MLNDEMSRRESSGSFSQKNEAIPAAVTDTGCERDLNEDRFSVVECRSGTAWLVCDGMGGVTGGELAAQLAIDAVRRGLESSPLRTPEIAIKSAILEANRIIVLRRQNPMFAGMGTTIVSALFQDSEIALGHVGDSRAYLIRDGAIQSLTTDHTYVQELVEKGQVRVEDALVHPQAHILTRAIGSEPSLEVDIKKFWIWQTAPHENNDVLVLATDGLYSHVSDEEISNIVSDSSPQASCRKLVELAKKRGGYDNITVAIIPLSGRLQNEPPKGYNPKQNLRSFSSSANLVPESFLSTFDFKSYAVKTGIISFVSLVVTLIIFFIWLCRA